MIKREYIKIKTKYEEINIPAEDVVEIKQMQIVDAGDHNRTISRVIFCTEKEN